MACRPFVSVLVLASFPALAAGTFLRLYSNEAAASSFLQNDWNKYSENYQPNYALDDDPKTAWVEGVPGNGEGQSLTLRFSVLKSARTVRVRIRNGYQRSKSLLAANAAPRQVTLSLLNAVGEEVFHQKATLTRTWGWQQVGLSPPANTQLAFLKLRIDSTWPGARYTDTCISDVQVLVDSDVPYNAKAELAKKAALSAWTQQRLRTAKYFAALPKDYPFAATHYDAHTEFKHADSGGTPDAYTGEVKAVAGFKPLESAISGGWYPDTWKKLFDEKESQRIQDFLYIVRKRGLTVGSAWYRPVMTGHLRLPDGLPEALTKVMGYLDRRNFALFESSQATAQTPTRDAPDSSEGEGSTDLGSVTSSALRVEYEVPVHGSPAAAQVETAPLRAKPTPRVRQLYFSQSTFFSDRKTYNQDDDFLVCFDEKERPSEFFVLSKDPWSWTLTAYAFSRDAKGHVTKVTARQAAYTSDYLDGATANSYKMTTFTPTTQG